MALWQGARVRRYRSVAAPVIVGAVLLAGCSAGRDAGKASSDDQATARFCSWWEEARAAGEPDLATVVDPPEQILGPVSVVVAAQEAGRAEQAEQAARTVAAWAEIACHAVGVPGDATTRRLAPPLGAAGEDLETCLAWSTPRLPPAAGGVVLYGAAEGDPYEGPMVGVVWGDATGLAEGAPLPVEVRGTSGVAAPISLVHPDVPPSLGTLVTWQEDGQPVSVYGRSWGLDRAGELVAMADALERRGDGWALPPAALPDGFREVFAGGPHDLGVLPPAPATYEVQYRHPDGGTLTVSGRVASPAAFEAFRFLADGMRWAVLGGRRVLVGTPWSAPSGTGPALVTWQEPDGLVVRVVGVRHVDLAATTAAAAAVEDLEPARWAELVESSVGCDLTPAEEES